MNSELGVIFDVDGVLVDSYDAHFESWQVLGRARGFEFPKRLFLRTFGRTTREVLAETFGATRFTPAEIAELDRCKESIFRDILAWQLPIMDGAVELIDQLHAAGFRLAVGSSGPPENVQLVLRHLQREDVFHGVVTGVEVTRGKPDPQVFQVAAERLRLEPRSCAVVEDAVAGIRAAKTAGMTCVALLSKGHSAADASEADHVVRSLRELSPSVMRRWLTEQGA